MELDVRTSRASIPNNTVQQTIPTKTRYRPKTGIRPIPRISVNREQLPTGAHQETTSDPTTHNSGRDAKSVACRPNPNAPGMAADTAAKSVIIMKADHAISRPIACSIVSATQLAHIAVPAECNLSGDGTQPISGARIVVVPSNLRFSNQGRRILKYANHFGARVEWQDSWASRTECNAFSVEGCVGLPTQGGVRRLRRWR